MGKTRSELLLLFLGLSIGIVAGDNWNILSYIAKGRKEDVAAGISMKNYCESWRVNVELNNIRDFVAVPEECFGFVSKYVSSTQYKVDVQRAAEQCAFFLTNSFQLAGDGMDAWVFDIDETLLSTVPYFKKHQSRGNNANGSNIEQWMEEGSAPALEHMLNLYNKIRDQGLKVFLISARSEQLREATINNLFHVGYQGWAQLILRCEEDNYGGVQEYKADQRKKLVDQGYRLWGIVGAQWSSLEGQPSAKRTFKLPNPMYYVS